MLKIIAVFYNFEMSFKSSKSHYINLLCQIVILGGDCCYFFLLLNMFMFMHTINSVHSIIAHVGLLIAPFY